MSQSQQLLHSQAPLSKNPDEIGYNKSPHKDQQNEHRLQIDVNDDINDAYCDKPFVRPEDLHNHFSNYKKESNYQDLLMGDDIDVDKQITEREEAFEDSLANENQKQSFINAMENIQNGQFQNQLQDIEEMKEEVLVEKINAVSSSDTNGATQQSYKGQKYLYYIYGGNYPETVFNALLARGNWQEAKEEDNIEKCHFLWRPFNYPPDGYKRIDKRVVRNPNIFIYNHFEVLKGLTTKSGLVRSLKQYYFNNELARGAGYSIFDSTPTTFLLASGVEDAEYTEMASRYRDFQRGYAPKERIPIKHCVNNIWLVKPSNANQGRGIEIFSDLEDLQTFVASRPQFTCCVVQKYIERPLLFKGRKFDIRVWALFTHKHEVFMYKHGYLRTSSDDYNLKNGNNYVHLTNNCLQKFGDNYGVHEDGNTVSFQVLQDYLDEMFPEYKIDVYEHFVPRMKDLIIDSFLATKSQLNPNRRKHCYELLGYDFLIDEDFRLWMIEINTNPYFGVPNVFIDNLLPKMMDDLLDMVVDPIYPPLNKPENCKLPNDFELLYCESNSTYSQQPVNVRRPFSASLYPIPELAQVVGPKAPRQDLRYLKQFKISNLQLSTITYKKNKDGTTVAIDTQNNNIIQSPTIKNNTNSTRSKSLTGQKNIINQHQQQILAQSATPSSFMSKTTRSRSTFKNQVILNQLKQNSMFQTQHNANNNQQSKANNSDLKNVMSPQKQNNNNGVNNSSVQQKNIQLFQQAAGVNGGSNQKTPKYLLNKKSMINNSSSAQITRNSAPQGLIERAVSRTPKDNKRYQDIEKSRETSRSPVQNKQLQLNNGQALNKNIQSANQPTHQRDQSKSDSLLRNSQQQQQIQQLNNSMSNINAAYTYHEEKLLSRFGSIANNRHDSNDLTQEQLNRLFKTQIENIKTNKQDTEKVQRALDLISIILDNVVLRSLQLDYMITEMLQLFDDQPKQQGTGYHITQILDLMIRLSEKLSLKLILSKNKNSSQLINFYFVANETSQQKILLILNNISGIQPSNQRQSSPSQKLLVRQENQGIQVVKKQLQKKCLDNGLLLLQLVIKPEYVNLVDLTQGDAISLLSQLGQIDQKYEDLPLSKQNLLVNDISSINIDSLQNSARQMNTDPNEINLESESNILIEDGASPGQVKFEVTKIGTQNQTQNVYSDQNLNHTESSFEKQIKEALETEKTSRQPENIQVDLTETPDGKDFLITSKNSFSPDLTLKKSILNQQMALIQKYAKRFNNQKLIKSLEDRLEKLIIEANQKYMLEQDVKARSPDRSMTVKEKESAVIKISSEAQKNKFKQYESPFKRSFKSSPQLPKNQQQISQGIKEYETPEKIVEALGKNSQNKIQMIEEQNKSIQNGHSYSNTQVINQNMNQSFQNYQASLSMSTNNLNVSSMSNNKGSKLQIVEDQVAYSKTVKKPSQNAIKYAPILRAKQTLMPMAKVISNQKTLSQAQFEKGDQLQEKIARGRTVERRQAYSAKIQSQLYQPNSQRTNDSRQKAQIQYNQFYPDTVGSPEKSEREVKQYQNDATLDQINQKINDLQQNLNLMSQYTSGNKLRITSTKVYQNPNSHRKKEETKNGKNIVELINLYSQGSVDSGINSKREEDYNCKSGYSSVEATPNKVIMSSKQVLASEKNLQYYKRGTQVSQNRKSQQKLQKNNNYYQFQNDHSNAQLNADLQGQYQNNSSQNFVKARKGSAIEINKKNGNYGLYSPHNSKTGSQLHIDSAFMRFDKKRDNSKSKRSSLNTFGRN